MNFKYVVHSFRELHPFVVVVLFLCSIQLAMSYLCFRNLVLLLLLSDYAPIPQDTKSVNVLTIIIIVT